MTPGGTPRLQPPVPRIVIFAGPDGAGKTSLALWLAQSLRDRGYPTRYVWLRFSHLFSLPILAYSRLTGLTRPVRIGGRTHRIWEFYRSPLVSMLFPWTVLLDMFVSGLINLRLPAALGQTVVCDRYSCDGLVDLMIATRNQRLAGQLVGRLILSLTPRSARTFIVDAEPDVIRQRRPELVDDRQLEMKCDLYRTIAARAGARIIENDGSIESAQDEIMNSLGGRR
jgi:thymidylate kinase